MLVDRYVKAAATRVAEAVFRADLHDVDYDQPVGDPGWFGPDSAIWYVHNHLSAALGGWAGLYMEPLHPAFAAAAVEHSVIYRGEPSWDVLSARLGRSAAFVSACTFGSTVSAERACRIVSAMHKTVVGTLPDGRPYAANDPDALRFAYATLAFGFFAAHQKYHPKPLRGRRADEYFRQWARIAGELGATELPETLADVEKYFAEVAPRLSVSAQTLASIAIFEGLPMPLIARPVWNILEWAARDLLPPWARELYRYPDTLPVADWLRHRFVKAAIGVANDLIGGNGAANQALDRINRGSLVKTA
ncbi:oxygenase MpaB family protein [Mycobacterium hubeiense]|uniref:oxygenase MpaB family protein n=1 Tax=Mycobacterium hubeiense TaxID=1867256 RepID=UPI000C7F64AB|nr:oxygenase MpaB family protein [Mycobacterium sp. QGD 101]